MSFSPLWFDYQTRPKETCALIALALEATGTVEGAAERLGVHRRTLHRMFVQHPDVAEVARKLREEGKLRPYGDEQPRTKKPRARRSSA